MKKWNEPKVMELNLESTQGESCPEEGKFVSEAELNTKLAVNIFCKNYKPDKGITGLVCKHYKLFVGCTYNEEGPTLS